jgi:hypothetical protein
MAFLFFGEIRLSLPVGFDYRDYRNFTCSRDYCTFAIIEKYFVLAIIIIILILVVFAIIALSYQ